MLIVQWILQFVLAAIFLLSSSGKLKGSKMHKKSFEEWGMPQSFRVITGMVELIAAILVIVCY